MAHSHSLTNCCSDRPYLFDDFIDSGLAEENSPFLKPTARPWARNLQLKASILAAVLLLLAFVLSHFPEWMPLSNFTLLLVFTLAGMPSLIDSIEDLLNLEVNIDVLMTLAAFSSVLIGSGLEGALLLVLFAFAGAMEHTVTQKAKGALSSLRRLAPNTAWVIAEDGSLLQRAVRDLQPGVHILIKAGEVVPLDGAILEGTSSVNLVHLTGESLPVTVGVGESLAAGAQNIDGVLTLQVTAPSSDSTLAKIIRLVTQAQDARPRLQQWFESFSKTYATSIIAFAGLITLVMPLVLGIPTFGPGGSLYRALAFLIAASPCALILAIPITYLSAVSVCARQGILLKGGLTLDALASCSIIAFDKTGTLTTGGLHCEEIYALGKPDALVPDWVLGIAGALERNAVHPIAHALTEYVKAKNIPLAKIRNFKSIAGEGLQAQASTPLGDCEVAIGRPEYVAGMLSEKEATEVLARSEEVRRRGGLLAVLQVGGETYLFSLKDTPREGMAETLSRLRKDHGMRLLMLTGDHPASARSVAQELEIDEFYADLRPEDKLDTITALSKEAGLAMIGDGINDAPALARATAGIAMGKVGSTTATEAADIVLLQDNIERLAWLVGKAHATKAVVRQNLALASFAIVIASTGALFGIIPLWLAVIMHEGGTVLVGLNGLRLLRL